MRSDNNEIFHRDGFIITRDECHSLETLILAPAIAFIDMKISEKTARYLIVCLYLYILAYKSTRTTLKRFIK